MFILYKVTKSFPDEEKYGTTSQIRRATMSVILNYIEGYARRRPAVQLNFFEISYGFLKESEYPIRFSREEKYVDDNGEGAGLALADEIGAMLWTEIETLDRSTKKYE